MRGIFVAEYQFSVFHTARKKWIMNLRIYANKWMGSCSPLNNRCKVHPFSSLLETLQDFYFIFKFTITNLNWFYFQLPRNINGGFNVYGFKHNTNLKQNTYILNQWGVGVAYTYVLRISWMEWCPFVYPFGLLVTPMQWAEVGDIYLISSLIVGFVQCYLLAMALPHQRICAGLDILRALNISLLFEDNSWIIQ